MTPSIQLILELRKRGGGVCGIWQFLLKNLQLSATREHVLEHPEVSIVAAHVIES